MAIDRSRNKLGVGPSGQRRWLSNGGDDNSDVRAGAAEASGSLAGMNFDDIVASEEFIAPDAMEVERWLHNRAIDERHAGRGGQTLADRYGLELNIASTALRQEGEDWVTEDGSIRFYQDVSVGRVKVEAQLDVYGQTHFVDGETHYHEVRDAEGYVVPVLKPEKIIGGLREELALREAAVEQMMTPPSKGDLPGDIARCKHGLDIMSVDCPMCEKANREQTAGKTERRYCRHGIPIEEGTCPTCS